MTTMEMYEALHAEKATLYAEVERLRRLVDEREADLGRMHGETGAEIERLNGLLAYGTDTDAYHKLRAEIERLTRDLEIWKRNGGDILLQAEIERLNGIEATGRKMWHEALAEIERLTDAILRIDGINDNPADYNPAIDAVCDAILRPHLKP